jgi:fructose 1,6-bisphosphatase
MPERTPNMPPRDPPPPVTPIDRERLRRRADAGRPGVFADPEFDHGGEEIGVWIVMRRRNGYVPHRAFYAYAEFTVEELEAVIQRLERRLARSEGRHVTLMG